tara:strand:- start:3220 stop:5313 length:2094 start_codon:yes stop_codon:yes gene_type:complete
MKHYFQYIKKKLIAILPDGLKFQIIRLKIFLQKLIKKIRSLNKKFLSSSKSPDKEIITYSKDTNKSKVENLVRFAARNGGNNENGRISKVYNFQKNLDVLSLDQRFFHLQGTENISDLSNETRTIDIIAGCELTHFSAHLKSCGFSVRHSFENHLAMDPYSELISGQSIFASGDAENIIFSQVQLIRPLINKIQKNGGFISSFEMNEDIKSLIDALKWSIEDIRVSRKIKIWLLTHVGYHTPALGFLDYRIPEENYSVYEFLNHYRLELYRFVKSFPDVFVLDTDMAFEREGKAPRDIKTNIFNHRIRAYEQLGGHPEKQGGEILAEHFIHRLYCTSNEIERIKCIVVDCDNTLWNGVLREDGEDQLKIRRTEFMRLWSLSQRGIPICLCSKNDPEDEEIILSIIKKYFLLAESIVTSRINWKPKSQNIESIAEELNIGLNTVAFFDDSEFERSEVSTSLPDVKVFTDKEILTAPELPMFHPLGNITSESSKRVEMYKANKERSAAENDFGNDNFESFLMSCAMRLEARTSNRDELDRIYELIQRTNQMNATLKRLSLNEIADYFNSDEKSSHIVKLGDKFGDYGLIGTALCSRKGKILHIDELALSCRAMGRRVEDAILEELIGFANDHNLDHIEINVTKTSRNNQILDTLERVGFTALKSSDEQNMMMTLDLNGRSGRNFAKWFTYDENIESQID